METTMDPATKLTDILDSPRAGAALKKAGFVTVEDLGNATMAALQKINGVGQRTVEQLKALDAAATPNPDDAEVEEGPHAIHLRSKREKYVIWVLRGDRIVDQLRGSTKVVPPLLIQFEGGRGTLSRETYLKRKYFRDEKAIQAHLDAGKPWRQEAVEWLRSRRKHGIEYFVMTD